MSKLSYSLGMTLSVASSIAMSLLAATPAWAQSAAADAFAEGRALLAQAQQQAQSSRQALLDASRTRQQINAARAALRSKPAATAASSSLDVLLQQLERQQGQGAQGRDDSQAIRQRAVARFADGMVAGWAPWVGDARPLTMDDEVRQFFAHNATVRSVHPNQPVSLGAVPSAATLADRDMTLRLPMLAAQSAPADLDITAFQLSRDERFLAHIEVHGSAASAAGNASAVPLNRLHRWRLLISDLAGQPVASANVRVAGHMPGHVHGLPTQPRVTGELAPGVYLVEGLKFQMGGWWVMQFEVQPRNDTLPPDNVAFNLVF